MENRKIILVDSATNSKVTLTTDVTTFGELKALARSAGINYEGKDWLEGLTKTMPVNDDSLLPTNVNYKGAVTNNLVYMLSNTNKKIDSGADRATLYAFIKEHNLADQIREQLGKSYTNLKTAILDSLVEAFERHTENSDTEEEAESPCCTKYDSLASAVASFLANLDPEIAEDIQNKYDALMGAKCTESSSVKKADEPFTDEEINKMFDNVNC